MQSPTTNQLTTVEPSLQHEILVLRWLKQVALVNTNGVDTGLACIALTAFNCLNQHWNEPVTAEVKTPRLHAIHPFWHADLDWFDGEAFAKLITVRDPRVFAPMRDQRMALTSFSRNLIGKYREKAGKIRAWLDMSPQDDTVVERHFLGVFHPIRTMLTVEVVDHRDSLLLLFEQIDKDLHKLSSPKNLDNWYLPQEVAFKIAFTCAALLEYLDVQAGSPSVLICKAQ